MLRKTVLSLKSPTGAFIAALRFANANNALFALHKILHRLAYGVVFTGNPSKEKARNFSVHQEVSGFVLLKLELVGARPLHLAGARPLGRLKAPLGLSLLRKRGIYCSIGFIVGTGQGTRMKGFIFRYKPTHAASFLSRPYVTLRNSPQVTEDLV
ncbi:hypothetical protein [Faecalibacterium sp.]|uniref:hypothetical protein n=1 Tax=Faecalibacterium sp. TaxID=1971605 RepID=UPI003527B61B